VAVRLKDELSGDAWQRVRNGQVSGAEEALRVPEPLSDGMPMAAWQQTRNDQVRAAGEPSVVRDGFDVDWTFIGNREGSRSKMYVLTNDKDDVIGKSGPTIGKGVDLGQKNQRDLDALGLDSALAKKLTPYLSMTREPARDFVRANPLVLSNDELEELNNAARNDELRKLARNFDAASKVGPFNKLPRDAQTAITSLYFQYGASDPKGAAPNYWRQITEGDWEGAHRNLKAFGDAYQDRRDLEAERLQRDIEAGTLPQRLR
jgi:hypothetical protein